MISENKSGTYTSYDAYDDLEAIRDVLHKAQRKIYRRKLEDSKIDFSFSLTVEEEKTSNK